jgi:metal-responsive CopG/Arc/MetJ family transcriptional regulator
MAEQLAKKKRVQIDMSEKAFSRLERLRDESGSATISEVIRDAIEQREAVVRLMNKGHTIYAEDEATGKKIYLFFPSVSEAG